MMRKIYFFLLLSVVSLQALPSGGQLVQGHAALLPSPDALQVSANGKAILHWDQFGIASHEAVHFIQSQGKEAILNRVTSGSASEILGSLQANCPIYLINPQGIFIGTNACIDTAGFLAFTADLSNETFWQGSEMLLQDFGEGRIVNLGKIRASESDVFLIARSIDNQGSIEAQNGVAVLVTHELMLHPDTKQCVFIRVDEAVSEEGGIQNSGTIQALMVELKTRSPYERAIHHTGSIEALATLEQNGRIYLIAEEGGVFVNGALVAESGSIEVIGEKITLDDQAFLNASGPIGGEILVGQREKTSTLLVESSAAILANGAQEDGGNIFIWADRTTHFHGRAEAKALGNTGDGGFIEISALDELWVSSHPDLRSRFGKDGSLLLDPGPVTIDNSASTGPNTFGNAFINAQLGLGSFTISTQNGNLGGAETLTVAATAAIAWSSGTTLTLIGRQNVVVNTGASIIASANTPINGPGSIVIEGGLSVPLVASADGITINAATIQTTGTLTATELGTITLTGYSGSTSGRGINLTGSSIQAAGSVNIAATSLGGNNLDAFILQNATISSSAGNIQMLGDGSTGTHANSGNGINFTGTASTISASNGTISLTGLGTPGGAGADDKDGIFINTPTQSTITASGAIQMTGSAFSGVAGGDTNACGIRIINAGAQITSTGSGITMTGTGSSLVSNNGEGIEIIGTATTLQAAGPINLTGTCLSGSNSNAITLQNTTITTSSGNIQIIGDDSMGTHANAGNGIALQNTSNTISASNGTISLTGLGAPGGAGNDEKNGILINTTTQTVITASGDIQMTGTGFSGSAAGTTKACGIRIINAGAQITSTGSGITMIGAASPSVIGIGIGIQIAGTATILQAAGSLTLNGTGGNGAPSGSSQGILIASAGGSITSPNGTISLTGQGGSRASGIVLSSGTVSTSAAGNITGLGTGGGGSGGYGIEVTGANSLIQTVNGSISLTGNGAGTGVNAEGIGILSSGKINSTGTGDITLNGIASPTGGSPSRGIFVNGSSSTVSTNSGNIIVNGTGGNSGISNSGLEVSSQGKISSTSGSITGTCLGGTGTSGCAGIFVTGLGSLITTATGGGINLTGTGGGTTTSNQGIFLASIGAITTTNNAPITLTGTGSVSGTSSNEGIFMTAASTGVSTVTGAIAMTGIAGGGTADGIGIANGAAVSTSATGSILANAAGAISLLPGASGSAFISTASGNININASGNVNLTGGSAAGPNALVRCTVQGSIALNALNLNVQGGSAAGQSGLTTQSGDINVTCAQNCQYAAPTAGALAVMQTFGSNLTVTAVGSIILSGFTVFSTPAPTGNLLLIAGQNIDIGATSQVTALGTVASSLTLVVDNAFPAIPLMGPGAFILNAGGIVSAGAGTPVRIYTAIRSQNSINDVINGMAFVLGPFNVNTATEQWSIYYPGGTYGGAAFNIYYKEPQIPPTPPAANIAANFVQLSILLPILQPQRNPFIFPNYHFQLCKQNIHSKTCDPTFSPYGSFIFEDDVYWIGVNFWK